MGKLVLFSTTQGVFVYDDSLQAIVVQFKCKDGAQRTWSYVMWVPILMASCSIGCRIYLNDQHFVIYSNKTIYICNRQFTEYVLSYPLFNSLTKLSSPFKLEIMRVLKTQEEIISLSIIDNYVSNLPSYKYTATDLRTTVRSDASTTCRTQWSAWRD